MLVISDSKAAGTAVLTVYRKNQPIFEEGDTNMLIEVSVVLLISLDWVLMCDLIRYHHVLKSHWLDSKWN